MPRVPRRVQVEDNESASRNTALEALLRETFKLNEEAKAITRAYEKKRAELLEAMEVAGVDEVTSQVKIENAIIKVKGEISQTVRNQIDTMKLFKESKMKATDFIGICSMSQKDAQQYMPMAVIQKALVPTAGSRNVTVKKA